MTTYSRLAKMLPQITLLKGAAAAAIDEMASAEALSQPTEAFAEEKALLADLKNEVIALEELRIEIAGDEHNNTEKESDLATLQTHMDSLNGMIQKLEHATAISVSSDPKHSSAEKPLR